MSKRDTLSVHIKWFYRTNEVPEHVYQLLIQNRHTEHKGFHRMRELFVSESTDVYPVSVLRGLCTVYQCQNIQDVEVFEGNENTFFFKLSYNREARRLTSRHGEIQVGASHQVRFFPTTKTISTLAN